MSLHSTAIRPLSTLTTYFPDGDQDTALIAELRRDRGAIKGTFIILGSIHSIIHVSGCPGLLACMLFSH